MIEAVKGTDEATGPRVMVVDDVPEICRILERDLRRRGFRVRSANSVEEARGLLEQERAELLLVDYFLGEDTGPELIRWALTRGHAHAAYCMSGSATPRTAVEAIRAGCVDLIEKPFDGARLDELLTPWLRGAESELGAWRAEHCPDIIGDDPSLLDQLEVVRAVADTECTVLIGGETGTGKELIARALHSASDRRGGPFVAINCAAIPESLIEDELFGHAKGAFTGAQTARGGRIASADGGTLFFDEIGDMPLAAQAKLLRALQDRVVIPVGADEPVPFDVRIVAATNRDLESMVEAGTFRADLLFRLAVVSVQLPALRDRRSDILALASAFVAKTNLKAGRNVQGFDASAEQALLDHAWMGNIRELANVIDRAVILKRAGILSAKDLLLRAARRAPSTPPSLSLVPPLAAAPAHPVAQPVAPAHVAPAAAHSGSAQQAADAPVELAAARGNLNLREAVEKVEREMISAALEKTGGNRTEAAALLGLNRTTLVEKLRKTSGA